MMPVFDLEGKSSKNIELPREIFAVEASPKLLAQYVRVYLANQRQGNQSTKTRSEVNGSTRKIYRQKGTGRARHGAKKAPIFVGGGIAFGPQPRDFSLKMNKKQKRKALFYSLSLKAQNNSIMGLTNDALAMKPKTKIVSKVLGGMGVGGKKILLVLPTMDNNLHLASRNMPNVEILAASNINPYTILNHEVIVFSENAIENLTNHFLKSDEN